MKYHLSAYILAAACLLPLSAFAQTKPIKVYVSAFDTKGAPVADLAAADFRVREDGVAREVLKAGPATEPLTIALLIDDSQAASRSTQMIRDGVQKFVTGLAGKGEIAIITYGERPTIAVDYTTDQKKLLDGASRLFPKSGSGAYLLDAIVDASKGLQKRAAARPVIAVFMLEDVEFSNRSYDQVLDQVAKSGATLDVIALGQANGGTTDEIRNRNQVISRGTEQTGGRRDQILAATALPGEMAQLADELVHQYAVTYARPDTLIPPSKIEVTVTRPGVTARAKTRTGLTGAK